MLQFSTFPKMDAVRGVDTIFETESQVQGERKGTIRCNVVCSCLHDHLIMIIMIIMITMIAMMNTIHKKSKSEIINHITKSEYSKQSVQVQELAQPEIIPMPFVTENSRISLIAPVIDS